MAETEAKTKVHGVCHFEIPADNIEKMKGFYEKLFDWKITKMEGYGEYYGIDTGAEPMGGMMKKPVPEACPMNYIRVEDVDKYSEKLQSLGGQIVMKKTAVPGMGWFTVGLDPENNAVGLWEDDRNAGK